MAAWPAASPMIGCDLRSAGSAASRASVTLAPSFAPAAVTSIAPEPAAAQADQAARALEPLLQAIEEIDATGERHRAGLAQGRDGIGDGLGLDPFEVLHDRVPFRSAASTVRGVIGSSRIRTPIAL